MADKAPIHPNPFWLTQRNYDRLSRWYDLLAGRGERKAQEIGLELLGAKEGDSVLEIGFGTGRALLDLALSVGKSGKVWGVEISPGMLSQTRRKIGLCGLSDRVVLLLGNAVHLPLRSDSYDALFMSFTIELFSDEDCIHMLSECRRVLKGDGVLGVVALVDQPNLGLMSRMYQWAHGKLPNLIDCRPIDAQRLLSQAGFIVGEVSEMALWGLPVLIILAGKAV